MSISRWKAFAIHLGLSAAIFAILLYLIVFVWYPQPYFAADGGWRGVGLIIGVGLVLGPLLTLIVFKPGKRGLEGDLVLIGVAQVIALSIGTWVVYDQRLVMVTFADGDFYALNRDLIEDAGGQAPVLADQITHHPGYAFVRLPTDSRERQEFRLKTLFSGRTFHMLGDRYEALGKENMPEVMASGVAIETYQDTEQNRAALANFLRQHGGKAEDYAFLPLHCRYAFEMLALRRVDGAIVDTVAIKPRFTLRRNDPAKPKITESRTLNKP
jgi:hypothetical protein